MRMPGVAEPSAFVVVALGSSFCAFPLRDVVETMRPLPIDPIAGAPPFVLGLSILRGAPVPVVDLGRLLGMAAYGRASRFVTLRVGERRVAIAVDAVVGVRLLDMSRLRPVAPLLGAASSELVEALGTLDAHLLLVLEASLVLPERIGREPAAA